jgi:hypothetical protein
LLRETVEISELRVPTPHGIAFPVDVLSGRFQVDEHVSSGGMGTIYRGSDRFTGTHRLALAREWLGEEPL